MSETQQAAVKRIASRLPEGYGFDPATITLLITTILPEILGCLFRNDDTDPYQYQSRVRALNERNPVRLLRRTTRAVKVEAWREKRQRLSDDEAKAIAEAMIAEAMAAEPVFGTAVGRDVQKVLFGEGHL
jgi:hypothetical protein